MQSLEYLEPERLSLKLKNSENKEKLVIVDVREEDFIGGHIKGALHIPSYQLPSDILNLVQKTRNAKEVVFYCSLSQKRYHLFLCNENIFIRYRGPAGAKLFLETQKVQQNTENLQKKELPVSYHSCL